MSRKLALAAALALAGCSSPAAGPEPLTPDTAPQVPLPAPLEDVVIRFLVTFPEVQAHRVHVRLELEGTGRDAVDLALPVWTPGSYLVREFARNVIDLTVSDAAGRALQAVKLDKNTWRVPTPGGCASIDYVLYANERSVRTSHADADHAFLSPAATFFFVRGAQQHPARVEIEAPPGWHVFTALPREGGAFVAPDYDTLVDSPLELGPHRELSFEHAGVPHRIVLAGHGYLDEAGLQRDVAAIVAEVASIFDVMPLSSYTFLFELVDSGGGGLEHKDSSMCMVSRWKLADPKGYRDFLSLVAHEYFHAWNGKRLRPAALGPFDYDGENYTRDLWVVEGITSYYDELSTARARLFEKVDDYLGALAESFRALDETPGADHMSLSRASHDSWIKHYRPDENSVNSTISYYSKGALVALLLDLRLRRLTEGERTLADVLRAAWERWAARDVGYPEGAFEALATEVGGHDLSGFFAAYVHGTERLDPEADLAAVGLRLERRPAKSERQLRQDEQGFRLEPTLGLVTADAGGLVRVKEVHEGGPAHAAGLNVDDLILAIDEMRVAPDTFQDRLDRVGAEPVTLTLYRGQGLRSLEITPRLRRVEEWKLVPIEAATEAQRAAFQAWTGWELPEPAVEEDAPVKA